jgi:hypothetical protein
MRERKTMVVPGGNPFDGSDWGKPMKNVDRENRQLCAMTTDLAGDIGATLADAAALIEEYLPDTQDLVFTMRNYAEGLALVALRWESLGTVLYGTTRDGGSARRIL